MGTLTITIPTRPDYYDGTLTENQRDCITWYVLSKCTQLQAFKLFLGSTLDIPETSTVGQRLAKQFFGSKEAREYQTSYEQTLEKFFKGFTEPKKITIKATSEKLLSSDEKEEIKKRTIDRLIRYIDTQTEDMEAVDDPTDLLRMMKETGVLEILKDQSEAPRRYLPETCKPCVYRIFVEENVEKGNIGKVE